MKKKARTKAASEGKQEACRLGSALEMLIYIYIYIYTYTPVGERDHPSPGMKSIRPILPLALGYDASRVSEHRNLTSYSRNERRMNDHQREVPHGCHGQSAHVHALCPSSPVGEFLPSCPSLAGACFHFHLTPQRLLSHIHFTLLRLLVSIPFTMRETQVNTSDFAAVTGRLVGPSGKMIDDEMQRTCSATSSNTGWSLTGRASRVASWQSAL